MRLHIYTTIYGGKFAFVALEPVDAVVPEKLWSWEPAPSVGDRFLDVLYPVDADIGAPPLS